MTVQELADRTGFETVNMSPNGRLACPSAVTF